MLAFPVHNAGLEYIFAHIIQDFLHFMRQTGLSTPQINALLYIYHAGECQVTEIGALMDSSNSAASQLVERLVKQGLIERTEDPQDRRLKKLWLSKKGRQFIQDGVNHNQFLMDLMASLPTEQCETVHAALGYLAEAGQHLESTHKQLDNSHA